MAVEPFAGISVPPGDPGGVDGLVRSYAGVASSLRSSASRLRASPGEMPSWQGAASIAYIGLCLIAGEDADEAAARMERAASAASKYKDELTEAREDSKQAIEEARDAQERIDKAEKLIADAEGRLADARQRITAASTRMLLATGGVPSGAEAELAAANRDAELAEEDIRQGKRALERAQEDLERAQERGRRATERAKDSAGLLRAALLAASPGAIGLAVGAPATAPGASAAGLGGASPEQVAQFFRRIGPEGAERIAATSPELVGPLDGAPLGLRYAANRTLAGREAQRLEGERAAVQSELEDEREGGIGFPSLVAPLPIVVGREVVDRLTTSREEELEEQLDSLEGQIDRANAFSDPERQLLMYDPRGDGRVAEVFGDLNNADHATVLVPGIGNSMEGFDGELRTEAQDFHREADARSGGEAATVAWLGYDSPDGFTDPATYENDNAAAGGESLARSLDGINAQNPGAHTTVAGHSYGSVVTGQSAAHHGLNVDEVVLTGSPGPGTGVDHATDLSRGGEARVWAAAAPDDPVASPPDIPSAPDIPGTSVDDGLRGLDHGLRELGEVHGPSPAEPAFGARRFDTGPPLEPLISSDSVEVPYVRPGDVGVGSVDVPVVTPGFPFPEVHHIEVPVPQMDSPSIEHAEVPYPSDVNPKYYIDQHTTAYADPQTLAFRNLVSIALGRPGDVVPAP